MTDPIHPASGDLSDRERAARAVYAARPARILENESWADLSWDEAQTDAAGRIRTIFCDVDAALAALRPANPPATAAGVGEATSTDTLIDRFAVALKAKLNAAAEKYGFDEAWQESDWQASLIAQMQDHIRKGDPRDVAAYCAFAWHHGWSTTPASHEALIAREWNLNMDEAPRDRMIIAMCRYPDATAGSPSFVGWGGSNGWLEFSRNLPEPVVCWAWIDRDALPAWPAEPEAKGGGETP